MDPQDVVVGGSRAFVDALTPLLTQRLGGTPRVAPSPEEASAMRRGGARMLVYEHDGRGWLAAFEGRDPETGEDPVLVAALPPEQAASAAEISRAVSALVAWHGDGRPVAEAVSRLVAAREANLPAVVAPRRPGATPPFGAPPFAVPPPPEPVRPPAAPVPFAPPAASAEPVSLDAFFDGAVEAAEESAPPVATPSPVAISSAVWPGNVPAAGDGLAIVRAALEGTWPEPPLRAVTERLIATLTPAERDAATGASLPFDAAPVRHAVGLRWQVAAAIDSLPPTGGRIDPGATQAILMGIDDVLAELKELAGDGTAEALRPLEAVRNGLVKEAIDLTEALQQVAPASMVEEITTSRKMHRSAPAPAVRPARPVDEVRTVRPPRARELEGRHFPWALVVVLVLAVIAAAAYHGFRYVNRGKGAPPQLAGAPGGTVGLVVPQGKIVVAPVGVRLDPREVENFRNLEKAKGNEVRELAPGTFLAAPAPPPPPEPAPAPGAEPASAGRPQDGSKP